MKESLRESQKRLQDILGKMSTVTKDAAQYSELAYRASSEYRTLEKITADILKLNEKDQKLVADLIDALKEMREKLNALTAPPLANGMLIREDVQTLLEENEDGTTKKVQIPAFWIAANNGGMVLIAIDPELYKDKRELLYEGQLVIYHPQSGYILEIANTELRDRLMRVGTEVTIDEVIDESKVRIITTQDSKNVVTIPSWWTPEMRKTVRTGEKWVLPVCGPMFLGFGPLPKTDVTEVLLEEVPDTTFEKIGGLKKQIEAIRDAVELPYLYPNYYREYDLAPPKGVLLYGPPGCGKTQIAKAIANNLAARISLKLGKKVKGYFINIKGPELLNKWVGETERKIREIFQMAREKASEEVPVVIFFDEMESLFPQRGSGISSDTDKTIVPTLLSELDGLVALKHVIVVGASNRQELIDPAVLRPGRLDVRIEVNRPDAVGAFDILSIYLHPGVPLHQKYWSGKSQTYLMPNRFRDLMPAQWKAVDDALRTIRETRGIKRKEGSRLPAEVNKMAALAYINELALTDADKAARARRTLETQPLDWTHEEWQIDCELDAWNMLNYKTIEAMFIQTAPTEAEIKKNERMAEATYGYFTREGAFVEIDMRFVEVIYEKGEKEILYFSDFSSGAALESIHRRAKKEAIKRHIADEVNGHPEPGIMMIDLWNATRDEFNEIKDMPNTANPADWARISGRKGQRIVDVKPMVGVRRISVYGARQGTDTVTTGQYL